MLGGPTQITSYRAGWTILSCLHDETYSFTKLYITQKYFLAKNVKKGRQVVLKSLKKLDKIFFLILKIS